MNINYYYRNKKTGFSIGVVFDTIVNEIGINNQVIRTFLPYPNATIPSILKNGWFAKMKKKTTI